MSDLISRSALIEEINELLQSPYANQQQFGAERRDAIEIVRDLCVKRQPTAYSVDKVVKELETDYSVKLYGSGNSDNYLIPVKRAIEIVKQSGVRKVAE